MKSPLWWSQRTTTTNLLHDPSTEKKEKRKIKQHHKLPRWNKAAKVWWTWAKKQIMDPNQTLVQVARQIIKKNKRQREMHRLRRHHYLKILSTIYNYIPLPKMSETVQKFSIKNVPSLRLILTKPFIQVSSSRAKTVVQLINRIVIWPR